MKEEIKADAPTLNANMRHILKSSITVVIVFALVFLVAKIFSLENVTELRFLNYILLFPIVYAAIKKYYIYNGNKIEYFTGFSMAFLIAALGQFWYSIMFFIYLHLSPELVDFIVQKYEARIIYPQLSLAFILLTEGISIGVVVALTTMQYFKRKRGRWASSDK